MTLQGPYDSSSYIGVIFVAKKTQAQKKRLTQKQRVFCHEYVKSSNATQSAILAGYTKTNASAVSCALLKKPHIQDYLSQLTGEKLQQVNIETEDVLKELGTLAFSNMKNLARWNDPEGVVVHSSDDIPDEIAKCISSVEDVLDKEGRKAGVRIKLHDKIKPLEILAKYVNILVQPASGKKDDPVHTRDLGAILEKAWEEVEQEKEQKQEQKQEDGKEETEE
jgi:phage terminase small subunit